MLKANIKGKTAVMQELGNRLRARREELGLTLRDIEQSTKIGIRLLEKMEDGAFDALPEGIFARNFIRQYCDEVKLDPAPFLAELEQESETEPAPVSVEPESGSRGVLLTVVVILIIAGIVSVQQGWFSSRPGAANDAVPANVQTAQEPVAPPVAGDDSEQEPEPAGIAQEKLDVGDMAAATEPESPGALDQGMLIPDELAAADDELALSLRFQVTERCWVYLKCPDREMDFMLEPGEVYAVSCGNPVFLTLGNVQAVTLTVNGAVQPLPTDRRVLRDYRLEPPAMDVAP